MASGQMTVDRPEQLSMTLVHNWHITDRYFPRIRTLNFEQVNTAHCPALACPRLAVEAQSSN